MWEFSWLGPINLVDLKATQRIVLKKSLRMKLRKKNDKIERKKGVELKRKKKKKMKKHNINTSWSTSYLARFKIKTYESYSNMT